MILCWLLICTNAEAYTFYHRNLAVDHQPAVTTAPAAAKPVATSSFSFVSSMGERLVSFVHKTVDSIRYSAYKLGGKHFDTSHGIYVVDCSNYVDSILQNVYPNAYLNLVNVTGSDSPTSQNYYNFFNRLADDTNNYWNKISEVSELKAGDILVFRYRRGLRRFTGGHVMVVMDKPTAYSSSYLVRVADSAPSGHSEDTRRKRNSGIGIGTLLLKVNPRTGQPSAFAWKVGARWKDNVNIAMGRPIRS